MVQLGLGDMKNFMSQYYHQINNHDDQCYHNYNVIILWNNLQFFIILGDKPYSNVMVYDITILKFLSYA